MEDSNKEAAPAAQAPAPQEQPQKARSYTERFVDMEKAIAQITFVVNFHTKTMRDLMERLDNVLDDLESLSMVKQSVNAMMELSKEGLTLSIDNVAKKVAQLQKEATKKQLTEDLANGKLIIAETVEDDNSIIEFSSSPDDDYGLVSVSILKSELKTSLKGRRSGDVVDELKILGVYKKNPEYKEGSTGEQANTQQPQ